MFRVVKIVVTAIVFWLLEECAVPKQAYSANSQVQLCDSITNAQPGAGVPYRGTVRNSDYGLTVEIPSEQTGWGAAPAAPFHGFAIFLADHSKSCILFEIHIRVDAMDMSAHPSAKRVKLGNRSGCEEQSAGIIDGVEWSNVTVRFSLRHVRSATEVDDGSILLVTPAQYKRKNMAILREFMSHIRFQGKELVASEAGAAAASGSSAGTHATASETNCQGQAENYVITNQDVITGKDAEKDAQIRSFIWGHWHEHQPGCLVEKRYSKEGLPATTAFAIEQDKTGRWIVRVTRQWPPQKGSDPEHERIEYGVYSIQRTSGAPGARTNAIPETEDRSGKSYRLVFYDSKGVEVGGL